MDKQLKLSLRLELVWWIVTFILAFAVLFPILSTVTDYPFLVINITFVIIFVTFTRYVFQLKHTFLARLQPLKMIVVLFCLPLLVFLISSINHFQSFLDERGIEAIVGDIHFDYQKPMATYIKNQMILFGTGSIVATIILALRLTKSIWRTHNNGTV